MAITTEIGYCDSTLNLMMGCDGCELWEKGTGKNPPRRTCYAGRIISSTNGRNPNFPARFDKPVIYPDRAIRLGEWSNLTGQARKSKPWLNGYPRLIFWNDMGDGFTKELPLDWMTPYIPMGEKSPHINLILSKRVTRMGAFWKEFGGIPENYWIGTSITSALTMSRIEGLIKIPAKTRFLSIEPLLSPLKDLRPFLPFIHWVIVGGESGAGSRKASVKAMRDIRDMCDGQGVPLFIKQMGGVSDKRGDMDDLPEDLRIRELPEWEHLEWSGKTQPPPKTFQVSLF